MTRFDARACTIIKVVAARVQHQKLKLFPLTRFENEIGPQTDDDVYGSIALCTGQGIGR